jgi:transmembrane sensor
LVAYILSTAYFMGQQNFSTIEDFVFDKSFRDWVMNDGEKEASYWNDWLVKNPGKRSLLNYARTIVYALSVNHQQLPEEEIDSEIRDILEKVKQDKWKNPDELPRVVYAAITHKPFVKRMYLLTAGAAAVIILAVISIFYFQKSGNNENNQSAYYELPDSTNSSTAIEQINNSDTIQLVALSDGSKVQLFPKSKVSFSQSTFSNKREVFLTGEAFFDVQKNPSIPFFVYTKNMVTKVLGTSFMVKAYPGEKNASVLVRSGKVSVFKMENFSSRNTESKKLDGAIVTPNQQVVYDFATNQLNKTIVDKPVLLENNGRNDFVFNSTALKDVFKVLQDAYGITIMYDESVIESCSLSASMGNESFFEKLDLICKAVNASYETIDGTIFITTKGCK